MSALERQLSSVEQFVARLGAAESQLAGLTGNHGQLEAALSETAKGVDRAQADAAQITETVASAMSIKQELTGLLALEGPFRQLRGEMDSLQTQSETYRGDLARLRDQHEKTSDTIAQPGVVSRRSTPTGSGSPAR